MCNLSNEKKKPQNILHLVADFPGKRDEMRIETHLRPFLPNKDLFLNSVAGSINDPFNFEITAKIVMKTNEYYH